MAAKCHLLLGSILFALVFEQLSLPIFAFLPLNLFFSPIVLCPSSQTHFPSNSLNFFLTSLLTPQKIHVSLFVERRTGPEWFVDQLTPSILDNITIWSHFLCRSFPFAGLPGKTYSSIYVYLPNAMARHMGLCQAILAPYVATISKTFVDQCVEKTSSIDILLPFIEKHLQPLVFFSNFIKHKVCVKASCFGRTPSTS